MCAQLCAPKYFYTHRVSDPKLQARVADARRVEVLDREADGLADRIELLLGLCGKRGDFNVGATLRDWRRVASKKGGSGSFVFDSLRCAAPGCRFRLRATNVAGWDDVGDASAAR